MADQHPLPNFERCDAFWARREMDRPLLAGWVGTYEIPRLYPNGLSRLPEKALKPGNIDYELFRADYEKLFADHSRTGVDVPWAAFPVMVLPWVEAIVGCPIRHRGGNVWAEAWLEGYEALAGAGWELHRDWLEVLVGFTHWLVELAAGRFPVALSLMRGPADLLAAIRGAQNSVYDLYDQPEGVEKAMQFLAGAWIEAAHAQQAVIPDFAGGYSFSVQNLWSRRQGGWFQDDAIAFWSPEFYQKYARTAETELSQAMEVTGCHLHSQSLFTIDALVDMPDLDVVEVNLDDVGLTIPQMIPRFQQVLTKKRLYVWGAFTRNDLLVMKENLPTAGLALQLMAQTPEQVRAMVQEVETIWGG